MEVDGEPLAYGSRDGGGGSKPPPYGFFDGAAYGSRWVGGRSLTAPMGSVGGAKGMWEAPATPQSEIKDFGQLPSKGSLWRMEVDGEPLAYGSRWGAFGAGQSGVIVTVVIFCNYFCNYS